MESVPDFLRLRCLDATLPLHRFEDHAYSLSLLLWGDGFSSTLPNASEIGNWLVLSAGLRDVSIITEGLSYDDVYCRNHYEVTRGTIASGIASELTRLLFVWGATEIAMRSALGRRSSRRGGPRRLSQLVGAAPQPLLHHECVAKTLLTSLEKHGSNEYAKGAAKARELDEPLIAQGTFAACQVRNVLVHGSVEWPDDDERSIIPNARIGRLACHALVFAIHEVMRRSVDCDAETIEWCEESGSYRERRVEEFLLRAHLDSVLT